jgi:hypothetical protein
LNPELYPKLINTFEINIIEINSMDKRWKKRLLEKKKRGHLKLNLKN